jgi:small-conductance mechanosensitive channel
METLKERIDVFLQVPAVTAGAIVVGAILLALLVRTVVFPLLIKLARKSHSEIDDQLIRALRPAVVISVILAGLTGAVFYLSLSPGLTFVIVGIIKTVAVLIWCSAIFRIGSLFLDVMSRHHEKLSWIEPKTLPLLEIVWKALVVGGLVYFLLVSWRVNPTSFLASAGILGLAIGFAAKDTLANLFAGIFIVADAPFQIGDYVVLDDELRGKITNIGIRSSRLLTRDDIEVTVPNAVIGAGKIVNETGGPYQKMRVRVKVNVAYGTDVDLVRRILLSCITGIDSIVSDPEPRVRFREFGNSGLLFELLAWIQEPVYRGRVLDQLNEAVYKAFYEAGIEIPFSKHDLYLKEMPKS